VNRVNGNGTRRGRPRHPDVLTPAEWRTVDAVRHGLSTRRIAERRGVSTDAVKFHLANAMAKLGLSNRAQMRAWRGVPADSGLNTSTRGTADMDGGTQIRLGPIGQISRHVRDFDGTVAWYAEVLGLEHLYTFGQLAFFDCGGTRLFLSPPEPGVEAGTPSILYFTVPDIQRGYDELTARGVVFSGAPHMLHRHASGVEEWMAFFEDPEGHPLAIMAQAGPDRADG
jgi:DNA-binding CsgD family transcriptional regulator/catechol 2,3-dioxygenase-like lactoylglutathione lyase family enzyme